MDEHLKGQVLATYFSGEGVVPQALLSPDGQRVS
jgi:hypothetical protein